MLWRVRCGKDLGRTEYVEREECCYKVKRTRTFKRKPLLLFQEQISEPVLTASSTSSNDLGRVREDMAIYSSGKDHVMGACYVIDYSRTYVT